MDIRRDTASVVLYRTATVGVQNYLDVGTIPCQRFVDGVVDNLVYKVMQPLLVGGRNVHTRTFTDMFQPVEYLYLLGAVFGFYSSDELKALARKAYLNIHCAVVEVEGLSCLEAIREGVVPVIAEGHLAATSQFALDERSIFPELDARALAEKIDWWIEHPVERLRMGQVYADSARKYDIEASIAGIIDMYTSALAS